MKCPWTIAKVEVFHPWLEQRRPIERECRPVVVHSVANGGNLKVMISSRVSKQVVLEVNSMAKCSNLWKVSREFGAFLLLHKYALMSNHCHAAPYANIISFKTSKILTLGIM